MWQNIVRLTKNLKKKWLYVCVGARTHPKHIKKKVWKFYMQSWN